MLAQHLQSCRCQLNTATVQTLARLSPLGAAGSDSSSFRPATAPNRPIPDEPNCFQQWWALIESMLQDPGVDLNLCESAAKQLKEEVDITREALSLPTNPSLAMGNGYIVQAPRAKLLAPFGDLQELEARLQACAGIMGIGAQGSYLNLLNNLASCMSGNREAADDWAAIIAECCNRIRRMIAEWYLHNLDQEMGRQVTDHDQELTQIRHQLELAAENHSPGFPTDDTIQTLRDRLERHLERQAPIRRPPEEFIPPAWYLRRGMVVMLDLCGSTAINDTGDSRARRFTAVYRDINRCLRRTIAEMEPVYGAIEHSVNTWGDAILLVFDADALLAEPTSHADLQERRHQACELLAEILRGCLPAIHHALEAHRFAMRGGVAAGDYQRLYNSLRDDLDVTGPAVFLAARLEPMAINGEVLIFPQIVLDSAESPSDPPPWSEKGWLEANGYKPCERKVVKRIEAGQQVMASGDGITLIRWRP